MLKSFFRSINSSGKIMGQPSIKIYHNTDSTMSINLLNKLNSYSRMPCTLDKYKDHTHSSNNWFSAAKSNNNSKFNVDLKINKTLSYQDYMFIMSNCIDMHPDNKTIMEKYLKLNKSYTHEPLNIDTFEKLGTNMVEPLIIDFDNHLIANDDKSFDRLMSNYLSCGIQNPSFINARTSDTKTDAQQDIVHPHVAEFADLY